MKRKGLVIQAVALLCMLLLSVTAYASGDIQIDPPPGPPEIKVESSVPQSQQEPSAPDVFVEEDAKEKDNDKSSVPPVVVCVMFLMISVSIALGIVFWKTRPVVEDVSVSDVMEVYSAPQSFGEEESTPKSRGKRRK